MSNFLSDSDRNEPRIHTQDFNKSSRMESNTIDPNVIRAINMAEPALFVLGMLSHDLETPIFIDYDIKEDYEWFTSGQVEIDSYKGKYIAIWRKQIVGDGETAVEAERIARAHYGNECRPAIVYISENEDSIL